MDHILRGARVGVPRRLTAWIREAQGNLLPQKASAVRSDEDSWVYDLYGNTAIQQT
ncbi:hypothetical protein ES707_02783 [subsurface metagenome]